MTKSQKRGIAKFVARSQPTPEFNETFRVAVHVMENTHHNLFITGKAGTGKSTLLSYFCRTTKKEPVVLAPTGVAALNVKGQTIHSFFNFYFDVTPEKIRSKKSKPRNPKLYKKLKMIIIDEVSMVRADIIDCVDAFLRMYGPHPARPFGGVQMVFVGDLYQLPPVVRSEEEDIFASVYTTPYFFSAHVLEGQALELIELDKVYRQKEQSFIDLLNKIRDNAIAPHDLAHINSRVVPTQSPKRDAFHVTLTTTNATADKINDSHLAALKGKMYCATARIEGNFGKEYYPTAPELQYKLGAQIMLLNNDSDRRWVNGSIGVIEDIKKDEDGDEYLTVKLQDNRATVEVYPHVWEVFRFGLEANEIVAESAGTFTQYPFRLAWAITIHKSQGKTFERVVIDIGRGAFASGQMYVALSRCTSFAGVTLKTAIRPHDIRTDERIYEFLSTYTARSVGIEKWLAALSDGKVPQVTETAPPPPERMSALPEAEKIAFIRKAIEDKAALRIVYRKADDTETSRKVIPLVVGTLTYLGMNYEGMKAFCTHDRREITFRVDRILKIGVAKT